MKKMAILLTLGMCGAILSSCMIIQNPIPAIGLLYSEYTAPVTATSNPNSFKKGEAEVMSILGLVAVGDASIETAAKNGGITKIHHIDHKTWNILGIYGKYTTIVYGE